MQLSPTRQKVKDMYHDGHSALEIAFELRISPQRVYEQIKKLGLPSPSVRDEQKVSTK